MRYVYLGDKLTRPDLKGAACDPIRRLDGKCIVGKGNRRAGHRLRRRLRVQQLAETTQKRVKRPA